MIVKFSTTGSRVEDFDMEEAPKVKDVLAAAKVTVGDRDIKVNGEPATADTVLREGDHVQLTKQVKGAIAA